MARYLFFKEDFDTLCKKIEEFEQELSDTLKKIGESSEAGNTWHDNFAFEQAQRDAEMWSTRVRELISIKKNAEIISLSETKKEKVVLGATVTIQDVDTKEIEKFRIGSYMVFSEDEDVISYECPIAKILIGRKKDEICEGEIAGKKRKIKILKIE